MMKQLLLFEPETDDFSFRCDGCPVDTVAMMQCYSNTQETEWKECSTGDCGDCFDDRVKKEFRDGRFWCRISVGKKYFETFKVGLA